MAISAVASGSNIYQAGATNPMAQIKKNFDGLGKALQSGNLEDAKKSFAELQKNAPQQGSNSKTPAEIESLSKALESGDLKTAQEAYAKLKEKMAQGPSGGAKPNGAPPQGAKGGGQGKAASSGTSSDNQSYDKMDANKDGTVTALEKLQYFMKHPGEVAADESTSASSATTTASPADNQGIPGVDTYA
jgi:soluble cytochrome b562